MNLLEKLFWSIGFALLCSVSFAGLEAFEHFLQLRQQSIPIGSAYQITLLPRVFDDVEELGPSPAFILGIHVGFGPHGFERGSVVGKLLEIFIILFLQFVKRLNILF